jgi:hypothetical protein
MIWVPDIVCEGSVSLLKHHRPRRRLLVPNRRKANYSFLGNANFYAVRTRARARLNPPPGDFDPRIARRHALAPAAASAAPLVTAADLTPSEDLRDAWLASESAKTWHFVARSWGNIRHV